MKSFHFIPPCLALAAATLWIFPQREAISEAESTLKRVEKAASPDMSPASPPPRPRVAIDWKEFNRRLSSNDMTSEERRALREQLASLSRDELLAALEEIGSMDLPDAEKLSLQRTLFNLLSKVDPAEGFSRYSHLFLLEGRPDSLAYALKHWAAKDTMAAAQWLDRQIQGGKFGTVALDGTNERLLALEGALLQSLLKSDPAQAEARVSGYPPEHRRAVINANNEPIPEPLQASYSKMVRSLIPQEQQAGIIGALIYQYTFKPTVSPTEAYHQIAGMMERIQATPAERELMVSCTAVSLFQDMADRGKVLSADVEALREWVTVQSPGKTGELTGQALAEAVARTRNLSYEDAAAMILSYHQTQADDAMLQAFLSGEESQNHKEEANQLAEQIKDPDTRAKALMRLRLNIPRP